jgi:hypothetical protein
MQQLQNRVGGHAQGTTAVFSLLLLERMARAWREAWHVWAVAAPRVQEE